MPKANMARYQWAAATSTREPREGLIQKPLLLAGQVSLQLLHLLRLLRCLFLPLPRRQRLREEESERRVVVSWLAHERRPREE